MARTIAFLEEAGVELAAPLHCTGRAQSCALAAALPGRTVLAGAGSVLELD
jgi:metal-dependent hydrolase (beta-lactamase superfamily II)